MLGAEILQSFREIGALERARGVLAHQRVVRLRHQDLVQLPVRRAFLERLSGAFAMLDEDDRRPAFVGGTHQPCGLVDECLRPIDRRAAFAIESSALEVDDE